jgi:hypothetical protein
MPTIPSMQGSGVNSRSAFQDGLKKASLPGVLAPRNKRVAPGDQGAERIGLARLQPGQDRRGDLGSQAAQETGGELDLPSRRRRARLLRASCSRRPGPGARCRPRRRGRRAPWWRRAVPRRAQRVELGVSRRSASARLCARSSSASSRASTACSRRVSVSRISAASAPLPGWRRRGRERRFRHRQGAGAPAAAHRARPPRPDPRPGAGRPRRRRAPRASAEARARDRGRAALAGRGRPVDLAAHARAPTPCLRRTTRARARLAGFSTGSNVRARLAGASVRAGSGSRSACRRLEFQRASGRRPTAYRYPPWTSALLARRSLGPGWGQVVQRSHQQFQLPAGGIGALGLAFELAGRLARGRLRGLQRPGQVVDLRGQHRDRPANAAVEPAQRLQPARQHEAEDREPDGPGGDQKIGEEFHDIPQFSTNSVTSRSLTMPGPVTICTRRSIWARRRRSAAGSSISCAASARR